LRDEPHVARKLDAKLHGRGAARRGIMTHQEQAHRREWRRSFQSRFISSYPFCSVMLAPMDVFIQSWRTSKPQAFCRAQKERLVIFVMFLENAPHTTPTVLQQLP